VGLAEDLPHHGVLVLGLPLAVLDLDVVVDHAAFQRARAIQRVGGDDVLDVVGPHPLQEVPDAAAFQLEDPLGLPAAEQRKRFRVVQGKTVGIDLAACGLADQPHGVGEDRQVPQAEEVHFQQPGPLHVGHRPLGDDLLLPLDVLQGKVLDQRPVGDDHRRGVGADVAGQSLDLPGEVHKLADLRIGVVGPPQLVALLQGLADRDVELLGHHRDQGVHPGDRPAQGAAHVADRGPGGQRAERADLRDHVLAVLLLDVLDHLAAALLVEVDVDVRGFLAVLVEKALEEEVVLQRADVAQVRANRPPGSPRPSPARSSGCPAPGRSARNPRR